MALQSLDGFGNVGCPPASNKPRQYFVPVNTLLKRGYIDAQEILTKMGVPFTVHNDDQLLVETKNGARLISKILSPTEQVQLPKSLEGLGTTETETETKFPWLLALIGFGVAGWALWSEKKSKTLGGLNGGPKTALLHL